MILCRLFICSNLYFIFQAEDGIRDYKVTGVQTCALPISVSISKNSTPSAYRSHSAVASSPRACSGAMYSGVPKIAPLRSEERRVGKGVDLRGGRIVTK